MNNLRNALRILKNKSSSLEYFFKKNQKILKIFFALFLLLAVPFFVDIFLISKIFTENIELNSVSHLDYSFKNFNSIMVDEANKRRAIHKIIKLPEEIVFFDVLLKNKLKAQKAIISKPKGGEGTINNPLSAELVNERFYESTLKCFIYPEDYSIKYGYTMEVPNVSSFELNEVLKTFECGAYWDMESNDNTVLIYDGSIELILKPNKKTFLILYIFLFIFNIALIKLVREVIIIVKNGRKYFSG